MPNNRLLLASKMTDLGAVVRANKLSRSEEFATLDAFEFAVLEGLLLLVEVGLHALRHLLLGLHRFLDYRLHVGLLAVHKFCHLALYSLRQGRTVWLDLLDAGGVQRFHHQGVQLLLEIPRLLEVCLQVVVHCDLPRASSTRYI